MNHVSHEGSSSPVQLQEGTNGDMEFILHNKRTDSSKSARHAVIIAWRFTVTRDGYGPLSDIEILPHPYLSLYEAAFTNAGNHGYMNTSGFFLYFPFTDPNSDAPDSRSDKL